MKIYEYRQAINFAGFTIKKMKKVKPQGSVICLKDKAIFANAKWYSDGDGPSCTGWVGMLIRRFG